MPSLTLKGLPDDLLDRLRARAEGQRRSLNQEAIRILETALRTPEPSLLDAHRAFVERHGPLPVSPDIFENLRDPDPGRVPPAGDGA